jgi:hypothetical protein
MKNQVDAIRGFMVEKEGIAHFLNSSLNKAQIQEVKDDLLCGKTKLLYVAPESLTKEENIIYKVINGNVKCERYYSNCKYIEDIKFIHMVFIDKKYESFNPNLRHYLNKDGKSFIEKYRPVGILHPIGNLTIADVF